MLTGEVKKVNLTGQNEDKKRRVLHMVMVCMYGGWRVVGVCEEKQKRRSRNRNELASEERIGGRRRDTMVR